MPIDPDKKTELQREFEQKKTAWEQLREEAVYILTRALDVAGIKYHTLHSRIKTLESFIGKADRKSLKDPFNEVFDVVGLRVVCLFLSDIDKIANVIAASFEVLTQDNKLEGKEADSFGYMSLHTVVQMKSNYSGPRYDSIAAISFEIQVRTIAMDAWATTSHYLDYKTEIDIPSDLRRDFYALSGLFYVADKHFEMFFRSRKAVQEHIEETLERSRPDLDQELNLDSLTAYLKSKFPEREQASPEDVSGILLELRNAGYKSPRDLDELINVHWEWFVTRELASPPVVPLGKERIFSVIGVVRVILQEKVMRMR